MTTLFIIAIIAVGIIAFIINSRISRTRPDVEFEGIEEDNILTSPARMDFGGNSFNLDRD